MHYKILIIILFPLFFACRHKSTPMPRGFFRIDFPEKNYYEINSGLPYKFQIPSYAEIVPDKENPDKKYWINVTIPQNNAEVHISYYDLGGRSDSNRLLLANLIEETRELAYKNSIKANAIKEELFIDPNKNVFGTVYRIEGNAASPIQFFLTDSTDHFMRGALYIRATPDIDSLKPVIDFLESDVIRMIETTKWE